MFEQIINDIEKDIKSKYLEKDITHSFNVYHHSILFELHFKGEHFFRFSSGVASHVASHVHHHATYKNFDKSESSYFGVFQKLTYLEIIKLVFSKSPLDRSIALAAINTYANLSHECKIVENENINAFELLKTFGAKKSVAVIGGFPKVYSLLDHDKDFFNKLFVFELSPDESDSRFLSPEKYQSILPTCDVVLITSTTLINGTLNSFFPYLKKDAFKILTGPSTPLTPILLNYFDALCGSVIVDNETVKLYLSQGASYRQIPKNALKQVAIYSKDKIIK